MSGLLPRVEQERVEGKRVEKNNLERNKVVASYRRAPAGSQPESLYPDYVGTRRRAPQRPLIVLPHTLSEITGPVFGHEAVAVADWDLTRQHAGEPLGERIVVSGRVRDGNGRPVANSLIEIWQANAAGRYLHNKDQHAAPLDANFSGAGRTLTDADGNYRFVTVKPGAYPWRNHENAWRPAHIHFSLFGPAFVTRLVTQMYFPGDPLFAHDPIFQSIPDERARQRLISKFDLERTVPEWALGFRFDIVLRGREGTPFEDEGSAG
jgi:protocatechuate 3,4-dioxygenase beta subunit